MPGDSRRIYGPDNVLSPFLIKKDDQQIEPLVKENNVRCDGRKPTEIRESLLRFDVSSEAAGSAYFECGKTKVICSIYGPRDVIRRSEFSHKGQLFCEYKCTPYCSKLRHPYQPSMEEKDNSALIQHALESVVLLHKFPKARIEVYIQVLEDDGGALGCALTCAGAALCHAGVEMYDLVVGCSLVYCEKLMLLDPTTHEESYLSKGANSNKGKAIIGMMPNYNQIVMLQHDGMLDIAELAQCIKDLMVSCQNLVGMVEHFLQNTFKQKEKMPNLEETGDMT